VDQELLLQSLKWSFPPDVGQAQFLVTPVASKDPCWSSFHLSGGGGGSSVTGDRPRKPS
jgi:hypothetical protein